MHTWVPVPGAVCQESCWAGATRRPATQLSRHPTSTNCHTLLYVTRLTIERTVHQSVYSNITRVSAAGQVNWQVSRKSVFLSFFDLSWISIFLC